MRVGRRPVVMGGMLDGHPHGTIRVGSKVVLGALLSVAAAAISESAAAVQIGSFEITGTVKVVIVLGNAPKPTRAQIAVGTDGSGAPAKWAGTIALGSIDTYIPGVTGLTPGTVYKAWAFHVGVLGNVGNRVESAAFTTDFLIFGAARDGLATGMVTNTGTGPFLTARPDSAGGNNAVRWVDNGDAATGNIIFTIAATYFQGVNHLKFRFKQISKASAQLFMRVRPGSVTNTAPILDINMTTGAIVSSVGWTNVSITAVGGGWYEVAARANMAGADVTGNMTLSMGASAGGGALRNGLNQVDLHNILMTRRA